MHIRPLSKHTPLLAKKGKGEEGSMHLPLLYSTVEYTIPQDETGSITHSSVCWFLVVALIFL